MRLRDRTAVVTGAAGGIGRGVALALARRGCHLALADIDAEGMAETAALTVAAAAPATLRVTCHVADVARPDAVAALPEAVRAAGHPAVAVLVNNAGVALGGTFEQVAADDFEWLLAVNLLGVVRATRAFLPQLRAAAAGGDGARIANVSSVFGLIAPPGQTAYAASKFAVRGFSEALGHELIGTGVGVTVVLPGGVATGIAERARMPPGTPAAERARQLAAIGRHLRMPPTAAGEAIARGIEREAARVLVGRDARLIALLARLAPVRYWGMIGRLLR